MNKKIKEPEHQENERPDWLFAVVIFLIIGLVVFVSYCHNMIH